MRSIVLRVAAAATAALTLVAPVSAASGSAASETTLAPPEAKKICRGSVETGSLIKKRKTCMTKAQWLAIDEQNEREAYKMVEDNRGKPPGN